MAAFSEIFEIPPNPGAFWSPILAHVTGQLLSKHFRANWTILLDCLREKEWLSSIIFNCKLSVYEFKKGHSSISDEPRSGRLIEFTNPGVIEKKLI